MMEKNQNNSNQSSPWWRPAILFFLRVSLWIAGPIILALILGKFIDARLGTEPWFFIGFISFAFITSMVAIVKYAKKEIDSVSGK